MKRERPIKDFEKLRAVLLPSRCLATRHDHRQPCFPTQTPSRHTPPTHFPNPNIKISRKTLTRSPLDGNVQLPSTPISFDRRGNPEVGSRPTGPGQKITSNRRPNRRRRQLHYFRQQGYNYLQPSFYS